MKLQNIETREIVQKMDESVILKASKISLSEKSAYLEKTLLKKVDFEYFKIMFAEDIELYKNRMKSD